MQTSETKGAWLSALKLKAAYCVRCSQGHPIAGRDDSKIMFAPRTETILGNGKKLLVGSCPFCGAQVHLIEEES